MPPRPFPFPLGIGTDIVDTRRIRGILLKGQSQPGHANLYRFLRGFLSWREQAIFWQVFHQGPEVVYDDLPMAVRYLSGRWAAKEAAIKAVGHRRLSFRHVQILPSLPPPRSGPLYALILDKPASAYNRTVQKDGSDSEESPDDSLSPNETPSGRNRSILTTDPIPGELQNDDVDGQIAKISISHDGEYATAVCLAVEEPREGDVGAPGPHVDEQDVIAAGRCPVPDLRTDNEYPVAADFWTALTREVTAVRAALETPDEDDGCYVGRPDEAEHIHCLPGALSQDSRLKDVLFEVYRERVDSVFKPVIFPRVMQDLIGTQDQSSPQALMVAIRYMAVCSLSEFECVQLLGQKQDIVLDSYRHATESAISAARILEAPTVRGLQAFVIYLQALRTRRGHALNWTLLAVAVRLASALQLGKEDPNTMDFETLESRRRLWYSICIMDTQATLDRGSAPMIRASALGPPPLDNDDVECMSIITPPAKPSYGPKFTDMTFTTMTNQAMVCHKRLCDVRCTNEQDWESWNKKLQIFNDLEASYDRSYLSIDLSSARPIEILTRYAAETILACTRLLLRRPPFIQQYNAIPPWDDFNPMLAATDVLERHLRFEYRELAPWAWKEWPPLYALAVALAELCRSPSGPEANRTFVASCGIFRRYSCLPNDDPDQGMLWKPIAKLLRRVTRLRSEHLALPPKGLSNPAQLDAVQLAFDGNDGRASDVDVPRIYGMDDLDAWLNENNALFSDSTIPAAQDEGGSATTIFDLNPEHGVSWLDWDALINDKAEPHPSRKSTSLYRKGLTTSESILPIRPTTSSHSVSAILCPRSLSI
ncbi:hypothetical protein LTR78_001688 [Recurvomyces mirabilis]|uniref:Xylanolytic transcriptional activator regulatory domain-containing protein n=1 Tax=Recurvomyces mirabilis TaxID=574656 RepID=A0AAE0WV49_9PEZI|nr:hypothetical protein LTR78_001688 [Recurvomyces mirabilis]KAK5151742.1 hypothetical protein LTS14_008874 [Recurvomyces mirabilis]